MREFIVEADGGSRGNPGPAGYGAVVRDAATGETVAETAEYLGTATNNVAEYRGLVAGLRAAHALDPAAAVHVRMDSKLVIEQMAGRWKIKHPDMKPLAAEAARVFPPQRVTYEWIPRERNTHADRLANEAMDAGARGERWSPTGSSAGASAGRTPGAGTARTETHTRTTVTEPAAAEPDHRAVLTELDRRAALTERNHRAALAGTESRAALADAESRAARTEADARSEDADAEPGVAGAGAGVRAEGAGAEPGAGRAGANARSEDAGAEPGVVRAGADARPMSAGAEPGAGRAGADVRAAKAVASPGWAPADLGPPATFVLLRHGETPLTPQKRFSGSGGTDPALSAVGREQAERVAAALARRGTIQAIVSSPLARTRETAGIVAARLGLDVAVDEGLRETDFGAWEGLTFGEVRERYPDDLTAWLASPEVAPTGGGESFAATATRIAATRDKLIAAYAGRTVLLVTHVTPIKTLVRLALGAPPESLFRMELSAASLSVVAYYADGNASLRLLNDTAHLR
ncbi:bifunctional RNase H/acid phosphatase [Streptomyces sp. NPDC052682]|uniref:bifunctional RNase H/acid phosphatase n=1 Tax=Streptomyces sp. NPDC052682 TaxID=3154954 RepID=UPI0034306CAC